MSTQDKFCLKWDNFQENINNVFGSLRKNTDFSDVTLACEDGYQVEVHKVILAASSLFFRNILQRNKHEHPLIYMRGMKSEDLVAIMDFLYYGEANMVETNLGNFLNIADELNLLGLNKEVGKRGESINLQEKNTTIKHSHKQKNEKDKIPPKPYFHPSTGRLRSNVSKPYQTKPGKKVSLDDNVFILEDDEDKTDQPKCVDKEIQSIIQKHSRKMHQQIINRSKGTKSNISKSHSYEQKS